MSHYTINYNGLSPQARHDKAIADIIEYMGAERYAKLTLMFSERSPMTMSHFEFACSFAGVQGWPVRAWYSECWPYAIVEWEG